MSGFCAVVSGREEEAVWSSVMKTEGFSKERCFKKKPRMWLICELCKEKCELSRKKDVMSRSGCDVKVKAVLLCKRGRKVRMRCRRSVKAVVTSATLLGEDRKAGAFTFLRSSAVCLPSS